MKTQYLPWYAVALAAVFVTALAIGVPLSMLALLLLALACLLMMLFMMRGMGGERGNDTNHDSADTPEPRDSAGRS